MKSHVRAPVISAAKRITPTAIPAFAPVESPWDVCATVTPEAVGVTMVDVDVDEAATQAIDDETCAQVYPEPQQRPAAVQYVSPCDEQPAGISVTTVLMDVEELLVLGTRQLPPLAQSAPYGQQPPPKSSAQR